MAGVNQPDFRDPVLSSRILGWPWDGSTAVPRVQPPNFERFSSELVATDALYVSDDKGTLIWYMSEIKRIKEVPPHPSPYIGHTCCIRCTCSQHVSGDLFFAVAQSPDIGFWSSPPHIALQQVALHAVAHMQIITRAHMHAVRANTRCAATWGSNY